MSTIERMNDTANGLMLHVHSVVKLAAWHAYGDAMPDHIFAEFVTRRRYYKTDVYYLFRRPFVAVKDPRFISNSEGVRVFVEVIRICQ